MCSRPGALREEAVQLSTQVYRSARSRLCARAASYSLAAILCFTALVPVAITAAPQSGIQLTYLGTAGWQISDGKTVVLIDPYLTRAKMITPNDLPRTQDRRPLLTLNDIARPDTAVIDAYIHRADFILVTHTHFDHVLDVPYIARKTGALVIGTESTKKN